MPGRGPLAASSQCDVDLEREVSWGMLCATRQAASAACCGHALSALRRDGDILSTHAKSSGWWPLLQERGRRS